MRASFERSWTLLTPPELSDEVPPPPADYGRMVERVSKDWDVTLMFEPGRVIVGKVVGNVDFSNIYFPLSEAVTKAKEANPGLPLAEAVELLRRAGVRLPWER